MTSITILTKYKSVAWNISTLKYRENAIDLTMQIPWCPNPLMCYTLHNIFRLGNREMKRKEKKNQHWTIRRGFEPVGLTLLKNW